jgi:hypothetical protein
MRRTALIAAVILVVVCGSMSSASAAGQFDGVWSVTLSSTQGTTSFFSSIHQNDNFLASGFNLVILSVTVGHSWSVALVSLSGQAASGTLLDNNEIVIGSVSITFTDSLHFNGQGVLQGVPFTITGVRVF